MPRATYSYFTSPRVDLLLGGNGITAANSRMRRRASRARELFIDQSVAAPPAAISASLSASIGCLGFGKRDLGSVLVQHWNGDSELWIETIRLFKRSRLLGLITSDGQRAEITLHDGRLLKVKHVSIGARHVVLGTTDEALDDLVPDVFLPLGHYRLG